VDVDTVWRQRTGVGSSVARASRCAAAQFATTAGGMPLESARTPSASAERGGARSSAVERTSAFVTDAALDRLS